MSLRGVKKAVHLSKTARFKKDGKYKELSFEGTSQEKLEYVSVSKTGTGVHKSICNGAFLQTACRRKIKHVKFVPRGQTYHGKFLYLCPSIIS
jgi:hypothetical protein